MPNIFDNQPGGIKTVFVEESKIKDSKNSSSSTIAGFLGGTITLCFLAVTAPVYIHALIKLANWSWNLI